MIRQIGLFLLSLSVVTVGSAQDTAPKPGITCVGVAVQGGAALCQTSPFAKVKIGRSETDFYYETADAEGRLIVGFDRDERYTFVEAHRHRHEFRIPVRKYKITRIDGVPKTKPRSEEDRKKTRESSARKQIGFASRVKEMGFKDGFTYPLKEVRVTSLFGGQRILNGEPARPHYGIDMGAPLGTPIYAPADGIVSMADDDLFYEGAMVLLDHGQGLISMYLHVNEINVEVGQSVKRGQQIATVGSKGRSTAPHLCWRLKWRNRNLDPEMLTKWPQ